MREGGRRGGSLRHCVFLAAVTVCWLRFNRAQFVFAVNFPQVNLGGMSGRIHVRAHGGDMRRVRYCVAAAERLVRSGRTQQV